MLVVLYFVLAILSPIVGTAMVVATQLAMSSMYSRYKWFWYGFGTAGLLTIGIAPIVFTALAILRCFG